jgi:predicted N-acetyltransferase YhbS
MPAVPSASVRAAVPEDLPALRRIAEAALSRDPDASALPDLLWPTAAPEFAVVAQADGVPVGFALGSLGPVPQDPAAARRGHVNMLAVDAASRRRGIGGALLAELEKRLLAAGAVDLVVGGATPVFAWPGIDVRYTAASCLVESRGYVPTRHGVNMTVDLADAEANGRLATAADEERLAAEGIAVRRLTEADREPITPWLTSWGGTWGRETLSTLGNTNAGTYIAVLRDGAADAEYVGFASFGVNRAGWFGPMGTGGPLRKLGIGGVLLRRCLADLHAQGQATAQICWVGPVAFYARTVDAYVERVFWLYRKER